MREVYELKVHLAQDDETGRWYIADSDIPGLRLEAENPYRLMERVADAAPELIELNQEEIISACRARDRRRIEAIRDSRIKPAIRPVFDSPVQLAFG